MPRPATRNDVNDVDPDLVRSANEAGQEEIGGIGDAPEPVPVERDIGSLARRPRLHLDEGQHPAAPGDNVHLADAGTDPLAKDRPTLQPQIPGGERLRPPAAALG
jgi:hypothetical protein